ncbi:response regulator [Saccharibacter floricola]|uniref:Phosphate regulon response regulator PhoB n=1 Tax=Saccharibacter floricola DSM 15669 TaxID=1123227 RepID=A0ABQ0NYJ0_9PROT|nr:response regulator [Saccharibacter floricola]GBQ06173.1 phosphate regulon response regulator PhoB [Saccharibacter floricola DSM 15669]
MTVQTVSQSKGWILIVEDDPSLLCMIKGNLEQRGYRVNTAPSGEDACRFLEVSRPDAVILDWMLPGMSGLEICRFIRQKAALRDVPILFLTARSDECDVIQSLDTGADDHLVKPCSMDTLDARLRALLRRHRVSNKKLVFANLSLDPETHRVERDHVLLSLGPTEYRILDVLMRHPRKVFSREDLLKRVWGENVHVEPRTIDVHIRRLRKAINQSEQVDLVRTVRSAGYALDDGALGH